MRGAGTRQRRENSNASLTSSGSHATRWSSRRQSREQTGRRSIGNLFPLTGAGTAKHMMHLATQISNKVNQLYTSRADRERAEQEEHDRKMQEETDGEGSATGDIAPFIEAVEEAEEKESSDEESGSSRDEEEEGPVEYDSELEDYDHEAAGERIASMLEGLKCQERTEIMVTNIIGTLLGCAGYALVIGRSSSDMWKAMGINAWFTDSRISFMAIMIVVLLPLCLLRDLSKLAFTSMLGLACELSVIIFMIARYIGGEYQPGGRYYDSQEPGTQQSWEDADGPSLFDVNLTALVLVGTASNAFIAHWNSPKFYHQLRDRKPRSFLKATVGGFTIALVLNVVCMIVGYLSFGKNCQGNILHNYSAKDQWATCSSGAMLFATIFGFPINFTGLRTAFLALFGLGSRRRIWVSVNVFLLAVICVLGFSFTDLGVLAAFAGSLLCALVIFVYPGLMVMWSYNRSQTFSSGKDIFRRVEGECVAPALVVFGVMLSLFGTTTVVLTDMLGVKLQ